MSFVTNKEAHKDGFWQGALMAGTFMFCVMIVHNIAWQHKAEERCKAGDLYSYNKADGE
jgi:hypothetical protein